MQKMSITNNSRESPTYHILLYDLTSHGVSLRIPVTNGRGSGQLLWVETFKRKKKELRLLYVKNQHGQNVYQELNEEAFSYSFHD
jgi:predicted molibdopterin-dependent oxidoreductase YjgC